MESQYRWKGTGPSWKITLPILLFGQSFHASHSYADDVQAYKHCLASQPHSAIRIVLHAMDTLNAWMSSKHLLLNPQKSQYICFGTRQQLDKLDLAPCPWNSLL